MSQRKKLPRRTAKDAFARRRQAEGQGWCGAQKRDGWPCTRAAGWGTDHVGRGRCRDHEGQQGTLSTVRKLAEDLATPIPTTPTQAIAGVLHLAAGQLEFATLKVGELSEEELMDDSGHIHPWIAFQRDIMNRVANYAVNATAMGLDERLARLAETQTRMVTALLEAVMEELDLTAEQRKAVGPAIRRNLSLVEGTAKPKEGS